MLRPGKPDLCNIYAIRTQTVFYIVDALRVKSQTGFEKYPTFFEIQSPSYNLGKWAYQQY